MAQVGLETAVLGGGCFWCLEAVFEQVRGVERVVSGYAGGSKPDPTYEEVCSDETGHAEVVQVSFDATQLTYRDLLEIFFSIHDPTTLNRQGADEGSQYRSVVLTNGPAQERVAREMVKEVEEVGIWDGPVVTQIAPLTVFYPGEPDHQGFYRRNPNQGYCRAVIQPKLAKFRQRWRSKLRMAAV